MMKYANKGSFTGKRVAISGSGNVAQYAALKCMELGATVVSMSDSHGCFIAEGDSQFRPEQIKQIAEIKLARKPLTEIPGKSAFKYIEGARPWVHVGHVDVALPCATQNEVNEEEAQALVDNGTLFVAEGSNSEYNGRYLPVLPFYIIQKL
jgi:glutamate dehydrogenase (NADP+)